MDRHETYLSESRRAFQQAIDSGHAQFAAQAAVHLGQLLSSEGDMTGAAAAYQQAIDSGHAQFAAQAAVHLGQLLSSD